MRIITQVQERIAKFFQWINIGDGRSVKVPIITEVQCPNCKHIFVPRVAYPKRCTQCSYRYPLGRPPE